MGDTDQREDGRNKVISIKPNATNQMGMRLANERLILALIRRYSGIAKADIAKLTGLTPQAANIIINRLELDGLLCRQPPVRGKVGQPAIPYKLDPGGAFSIGLSISRQTCEMVLMNFVADIRERVRSDTIDRYTPDQIVEFAIDGYNSLISTLTEDERNRVCGYGMSLPLFDDDWYDQEKSLRSGSSSSEYDIGMRIAYQVPLHVQLCNNAAAACGAELELGSLHGLSDFLYLHLDVSISGSLVLDNKVFYGSSGRAGAVGLFPVQFLSNDQSEVVSLRDLSLWHLGQRACRSGPRPKGPCGSEEWWSSLDEEAVEDWIVEITPKLACVALAAAAICDIDVIVIDGLCPNWVRRKIVDGVAGVVEEYAARQEVSKVKIISGSLGASASVLGAALLPMAHFGRVEGESSSVQTSL